MVARRRRSITHATYTVVFKGPYNAEGVHEAEEAFMEAFDELPQQYVIPENVTIELRFGRSVLSRIEGEGEL